MAAALPVLFVLWSLPAQAVDEKRHRNGTLARQRSNHLRAAHEDSRRQWRAAQDLRDSAISAQEHGSARLLAG